MWSPQRWHTECSVGDSKLLQAFGNLHHRQRSILWHLNCFMKGKRTPDIKREEFLILLKTWMSRFSRKKKKKKVSSFAFLNKVQIYCCKGFHWFSSGVQAGYVCMRSWTPTVEPWKPALVACSSRLQYRCPSPRCLQLRYRWYTQRWLSVGW